METILDALRVAGTGFAIVGGLAMVFGAIYIARNKGSVDALRDAVESYSTAYEAAMVRIDELEAKVAEQEKRLAEQAREISALEGRLAEKREFNHQLVETIAATGLCVKAWDCENREYPGQD